MGLGATGYGGGYGAQGAGLSQGGGWSTGGGYGYGYGRGSGTPGYGGIGPDQGYGSAHSYPGRSPSTGSHPALNQNVGQGGRGDAATRPSKPSYTMSLQAAKEKMQREKRAAEQRMLDEARPQYDAYNKKRQKQVDAFNNTMNAAMSRLNSYNNGSYTDWLNSFRGGTKSVASQWLPYVSWVNPSTDIYNPFSGLQKNVSGWANSLTSAMNTYNSYEPRFRANRAAVVIRDTSGHNLDPIHVSPDYSQLIAPDHNFDMSKWNAAKQKFDQKFSAFNSNLNAEKTAIANRANALGGMYDSAFTEFNAANINNVDDYDLWAKSLQDNLGGIGSFSNDTLDFVTTRNGQYDINGKAFNDIQGDTRTNLQGLQTDYNDLLNQRTQELSRYNDFRSDLRGSLNDLATTFDSSDLNAWNQNREIYGSNLSQLNRDLAAFETPLDDVNFNYSSALINDLRAQANQFDTRLESAKTRNSNFANQLTQNLFGYANNIDELTYADDLRIKQQERNLNYLDQQIASYQTELDADSSNQTGQAEMLRQQLNDLKAQREQEVQRLDAFKQEQQGLISGLDADINAATINDPEVLQALSQRLQGVQSALGSYDTLLNTGFGTLNNALSQEINDLAALNQQRAGALNDLGMDFSQLNSGVEGLSDFAGSLDDRLAGLDYRKLAQLDALDNSIASNRDKLTDYGSTLTELMQRANTLNAGDFGQTDIQTALTGLTDADKLGATETQLDALRQQRADELAGFQSDLGGLSQNIADAPIQNESDLTNYLQDLNNKLVELNSYAGSDATTLMSGYRDAVTSVDTKLNELYDKRNALEQEAQTLLENMNNSQYYNLGLVDSDQARLDSISQTIDLYNAQQAMDELPAMEARLISERDRINADLERSSQANQLATTADPQLLARERFDQGWTDEEYLALLAARRNREGLAFGALAGG